MRIAPDFDDLVREIKKAMQASNGVLITDPQATRIIARQFRYMGKRRRGLADEFIP